MKRRRNLVAAGAQLRLHGLAAREGGRGPHRAGGQRVARVRRALRRRTLQHLRRRAAAAGRPGADRGGARERARARRGGRPRLPRAAAGRRAGGRGECGAAPAGREGRADPADEGAARSYATAQPVIDDLLPAARNLSKASPDLRESFYEINRFFNMAAHNPGGREELTGDSERGPRPGGGAALLARLGLAQLELAVRDRGRVRPVPPRPSARHLHHLPAAARSSTARPRRWSRTPWACASCSPTPTSVRPRDQAGPDTPADGRDGRLRAVGVRPLDDALAPVRRLDPAEGGEVPLQGVLRRGRAARGAGRRAHGRARRGQGRGQGAR